MGRQNWRTPPSVFLALQEHFGEFDCDVAASDENHLCESYLTIASGRPIDNIGLWGKNNWCNMPFGNPIIFIDAAVAAYEQLGKETVALSHSNTSSPWFRAAVRKAALNLPDRRINYWHPAEDPCGANFDSVVWHFGGEAGTVQEIRIPKHMAEVRRLTAEVRGQIVMFDPIEVG